MCCTFSLCYINPKKGGGSVPLYGLVRYTLYMGFAGHIIILVSYTNVRHVVPSIEDTDPLEMRISGNTDLPDFPYGNSGVGTVDVLIIFITHADAYRCNISISYYQRLCAFQPQ